MKNHWRVNGIFHSLIIVLALISAGCTSRDDQIIDSGTAVELKPLGDLAYGADTYSCQKDCYIKLVSQIDTGYVINNDIDYEKFKIRANCLEVRDWPVIDFAKNTLLAGVIITPNSCCTTLRIDFTRDLSLPKYTVMVTLQPGPNAFPGAVFYWGLTTKLPSDSEVFFMHKYYSIQ
jgi:hypothetical protein